MCERFLIDNLTIRSVSTVIDQLLIRSVSCPPTVGNPVSVIDSRQDLELDKCVQMK